MRDFLSLGSSPINETCVQVGEQDYASLAKQECARFIGLVRRTLGAEPEGAALQTKAFPHDLGTYYEVVCFFDPEIQASVDYAYRCEGETPTTWKEDRVRPAQACLEVRSALEIWLSDGERSLQRLETLVRHWCTVYEQDEAYTAQALQEATRLTEQHLESGGG